MKEKMDKSKCAGCYNDFYNYGGATGNSTECWGLETAKLVMRQEVHVDQIPPYRQPYRKLPSCYSKQRYAYINKS